MCKARVTSYVVAIIGITMLLAVVLGFGSTHAEEHQAKPSVVRFGVAATGVGGRPFLGGFSVSVAHAHGLLERELQATGARVQWSFFSGGGTAVNEAFANGLLDVAWQGDMPAIMGRSGGLSTKLLLADGIGAHVYVAVSSDSRAKSVADLRGKRVALSRNTNVFVRGLRILKKFGLEPSDVQLVNMDAGPSENALMTHGVDAIIGSPSLLQLEYRGNCRVVYSTRGEADPSLKRNMYIVASEKFTRANPELTQRVVSALVKASHWSSVEKNRAPLFALWAKSGTPASLYAADFRGEALRDRNRPVPDDQLVAQGKTLMSKLQEVHLIEKPFSYSEWVDPSFVERAIAELGLKDLWSSGPRAAVSGATQVHTASAGR